MDCEQFASRVNDHAKSEHGIDLDIEKILDLIMEIVDCFTGPSFVEDVFVTPNLVNLSRRQKSAVRRLARRSGFGWRQANRVCECLEHCCNDCGRDYVKGVAIDAKQLLDGYSVGPGEGTYDAADV